MKTRVFVTKIFRSQTQKCLHLPSDGGDRLLAGVGDVLLLVLPRVVQDQGAASGIGNDSLKYIFIEKLCLIHVKPKLTLIIFVHDSSTNTILFLFIDQVDV